MLPLKHVILLATITTALSSHSGCKLNDGDFISKLGNICEEPLDLLEVRYGVNVPCDSTFRRDNNDIRRQPELRFRSAKTNAVYTVLMLDPDAPNHSLQELTFFLHWAVTGIKGADLLKWDKVTGNVLMDYMGPAPPSGSHRYMFVVLDSTDNNDVMLTSSMRPGFSLRAFLERNNLCYSVVGQFQYKVTASK